MGIGRHASGRSIDEAHFSGIREALMDSGVSLLTFLQVGRCSDCLGLLLASTFGEAWVLETGDCKT